MSRYALNLPAKLKSEAEELAAKQGVSLNQFIMWSVSEKVTILRQTLDDPNFPGITYRRGAAGWVSPVIRGTGSSYLGFALTPFNRSRARQDIRRLQRTIEQDSRFARNFARSVALDASDQGRTYRDARAVW